jgi:hypothetical protein
MTRSLGAKSLWIDETLASYAFRFSATLAVVPSPL